MGKENYRFKIRPLKFALVFCVLMALPVFPSISGINDSNVAISHIDKSVSFNTKLKSTNLNSCTAYFKGTSSVDSCRVGEVPLPAATWLFVLALAAFVGLSTKKKV